MPKHVSFGNIEQYRNIVKEVKQKAQFLHKNEEGWPVYDETLPLPVIEFEGTVKLHGTQSCVGYNSHDKLWFQSNQRIITPIQDNMGFANFAHERKQNFLDLMHECYANNKIEEELTLSFFGEFCGIGVNGGTAIAQLPKSFFLFGIKVTHPTNEAYGEKWLPIDGYRDHDARIYNIKDYKTYKVEIDFAHPELAQPLLEEMVDEVEKECPVAKSFEISEIGEGIVFTGTYGSRYFKFKAKGEKHKISATREKVPVDTEKLSSIQEFVEYAVTENRVQQAAHTLPGEHDIKQTGDVIRWVLADIIKEESDVLMENHLTFEDIKGPASKRARDLFIESLKEF